MDYNALIDELVTKLQNYFAATDISTSNSAKLNTLFDARPMPETDNEFKRVADISFVNVHYADSEFSAPKGTGSIQQTETITVAFYLQARTLSDLNGANHLQQQLINCMLGYRPANARGRMYISAFGKWTIDEGGQLPYIEMSFDTICQQLEYNDPAIGGALKAATIIQD